MGLVVAWKRCSALAPKADTPLGSGSVGMNVGGRRAWVAASKPEASSMSCGSFQCLHGQVSRFSVQNSTAETTPVTSTLLPAGITYSDVPWMLAACGSQL